MKITDTKTNYVCLFLLLAVLVSSVAIYGYVLGYLEAKRATAKLCITYESWTLKNSRGTPDMVFECREVKDQLRPMLSKLL